MKITITNQSFMYHEIGDILNGGDIVKLVKSQ